MKKLCTLCFLIFLAQRSATQAIYLDESFDDWSQGVTSFKDVVGDGSASGVDIQDVRLSNDERSIYLYFSIQKEINLQSNNDLALYLDIDNNVSTGLVRNGIGADLVYYFGDRKGRYYFGNSSYQIYHKDIGLVTLPTVTSDRFELGINRKITAGNLNITMGKTIKVILVDEAPAGDQAPNSGSYTHTIDDNIKAAVKPVSLSKQSIDDIRFLSYNVLRDNFFEPSLSGSFRRILNAVKPDIIGFCEIYDRDASTTAALVETFLPSSNGQKWYFDQANPDIRLVSRYPILERISLDGNGVFVLDVKGRKVLYIVAHLPCCDNETGRQGEVDKIMGFLRDVRYGISSLNVPQNTPIIISGDMNLVGLKAQQTTFKTGNIINNSQYGPDFNPDWDESSLEDAKPATTGQPSTITWYSENGSYSAGRLDYYFFSGSVLRLKNNYSLFTTGLTPTQLSTAGLQSGDVLAASDHCPLVADFSFDLSSDVSDVENSSNLPWYIDNDQLVIINGSFIEGKSVNINNVLGQNSAITSWISEENIIIDLGSLQSNNQVYILQFMKNGHKYAIKFVK